MPSGSPTASFCILTFLVSVICVACFLAGCGEVESTGPQASAEPLPVGVNEQHGAKPHSVPTAPCPSLTESDLTLLQDSTDREDLTRIALAASTSPCPEDHQVLDEQLTRQDFLTRLDSESAYEGVYVDLNLAKVMSRLSRNPARSARRVALGLIDAPDYQGHVLRVQLLIYALAERRPAPFRAIEYWDRLSPPDGPLASDVIEALCINQSQPALDLLERKFADPQHHAGRKLAWMRAAILKHRTDPLLLARCEKLLTDSLPGDLRPSLVEALFDYRPAKWYRSESPPVPPKWSAAQAPARKILRRIGRFAERQVDLTPAQQAAVRRTLAELRN